MTVATKTRTESDTMGQVESHLIMRHYEGFLKKGRIQGRWFNIGAQSGAPGAGGDQ